MIVSLGQSAVNVVSVTTSQRKTGTRLMALQYAVTAVLTQAEGVESFPGRILEIPAEKFNALVTAIVQTTNQPGWATNPGFTWTPAFTEAEGAKYLNQRGYKSALPVPYTPPMTTIVIQPPPIVVQPPPPVFEPEPIVVQPPPPELYQPPQPVSEPEPPPVEAEGVDKNTILWLVGAIIGGLILGGMSKQRRG